MSEPAAGLHTLRATVRFQDADAAGVVFFARYFDFFHDAYVDFLRARGAPLEEALATGDWIAPLAHAEADYRRPLHFGDAIAIRIAAVAVEETEFRIDYRIDREGRRVCTGWTRHVTVDPDTFRRVPVPAGLRRALEGTPPAGSGADDPDAGGAAEFA